MSSALEALRFDFPGSTIYVLMLLRCAYNANGRASTRRFNPFPTPAAFFFAPAEIGTAHGPQAQLTGESVGLGGTPAQRRRARGPPRRLRT